MAARASEGPSLDLDAIASGAGVTGLIYVKRQVTGADGADDQVDDSRPHTKNAIAGRRGRQLAARVGAGEQRATARGEDKRRSWSKMEA
jgi:hypothetical protein